MARRAGAGEGRLLEQATPSWRSSFRSLLAALLLATQLQPIVGGFVSCTGSCAQLWELPRVQGGPGFAELNAASGFIHTDLVLLAMANTTASLPVAKQIFQLNTLLSSPAGSFAANSLYLGTEPEALYTGPGVPEASCSPHHQSPAAPPPVSQAHLCVTCRCHSQPAEPSGLQRARQLHHAEQHQLLKRSRQLVAQPHVHRASPGFLAAGAAVKAGAGGLQHGAAALRRSRQRLPHTRPQRHSGTPFARAAPALHAQGPYRSVIGGVVVVVGVRAAATAQYRDRPVPRPHSHRHRDSTATAGPRNGPERRAPRFWGVRGPQPRTS